MSTLGARLKRARERTRLTQSEVCKILEISIGTLSGYERDYRRPDTSTLAKLSELYEVSTDWLLTGQESTLPQKRMEEMNLQELYEALASDQEFMEFRKSATEEQWAAFIETVKTLARGMRKP